MLVADETVGNDLGEKLRREDQKEDPLGRIEKTRFPCTRRVERGLPRESDAVCEYGEEYERIEDRTLDETDRRSPHAVLRPQAAERLSFVHPTGARSLYDLCFGEECRLKGLARRL
jgi:hypothetical protein